MGVEDLKDSRGHLEYPTFCIVWGKYCVDPWTPLKMGTYFTTYSSVYNYTTIKTSNYTHKQLILPSDGPRSS